jgi:cystine transport system substrate-binding protein
MHEMAMGRGRRLPRVLAGVLAARLVSSAAHGAVLNDSLMVAYLLRHSSLPLRAGPRVGPVERTAVVFRGGNPRFKAAVDRILVTARASGELRRLSLKWFGVDASREAR